MDNVTKILALSVAVSVGYPDTCVFAKDAEKSTKQSKDAEKNAKNAPRDLVEYLMSKALGIISSDITFKEFEEKKNEFSAKSREISNDKEEFKARIKNVVTETFSAEKIARFMLGKGSAKQLGKKELEDFVDSFLNMMISFYSSKLYEYKNATFEVTSVKKKGSNHYMIRTKIYKDAEKSEKGSIEIDWSVYNNDGAPRVFDVLISGVSMSQTQKAVISEKIKKKGIKKFLVDFIKENKIEENKS